MLFDQWHKSSIELTSVKFYMFHILGEIISHPYNDPPITIWYTWR